jgi:hypothetical protein
MEGTLRSRGALSIRRIRARKDYGYMLRNRLRLEFWRGWAQVKIAKAANRLFGIAVMTSELRARYIHNGEITDLGVLSNRVVTTAFVNFLAAQLQTDTSEIGDFKYHDSGTGTTAAAVGDTAMEASDGVARATGTQVASTNTYTSVGTITYTATLSITEHGLFSSAASTTLLDRSVFAAKTVVASDALEFTYVFSISSGG